MPGQSKLSRGTKAGNYIIEDKIGEGGVGSVYKAYHNILKFPVAIKVLERLSNNPKVRQVFFNSANILSQLHHPNIVALYDYGFVQNKPYMVMEYVEGTSLKEIIPTHPTREWVQFIFSIFPKLLSAVRYAHQCEFEDNEGVRHRGIIHGDIKPANILIRNEDRALKLTDFLLPDLRKLEELEENYDVTLELDEGDITTETFGTPEYMPPEQKEGEIRPESDIYTLGGTLYEALTGRPPTEFVTKGILPRQIVPYIPTWVEEIIVVAMNKDPDKRFHSVAEFEAVFLEALYHFAPLSQHEYEIILGDKIEVRLQDIAHLSGSIQIGRLNRMLTQLREEPTENAARSLLLLKDAILKSSYLSVDEKNEYLAVLNQIALEILKPRPRKKVQKVIWEGLLNVLKTIPDIAQVIKVISETSKFFS